ncbi:MAG: hypothetical protein N2Z20_04505 [Elusimicrobiales bacterium]|nr:hypothetical protein [Elusimicrobiales bacterium]
MKIKNKKTVILCVIDAVGVNTLKYLVSKHQKTLKIPFLKKCGITAFFSQEELKYIDKKELEENINSIILPITQQSTTADSLIGHREMVGIIDTRKFNLFQEGFPTNYIKELEKRINRKTFFNKMAGGIEAIEKNYKYHEKTGYPIVYASKCDPLIQFAMNEKIIPLKEQKYIADTALSLAIEMNIPITRAIARSYIRKGKEIIRTPNRYDAVLPLKNKTLIDILNDKKIWTISVGKTSDLVNTHYAEKIKITSEEFIDKSMGFWFIHPQKKDTNIFNIQGIINAIKTKKVIYRPCGTFIFSNLVDTDSLWGHTRDITGAIKSIEQIDSALENIFNLMDDEDLLLITTDHGMEHKSDYGYHSKEILYLIAASKSKIQNFNKLKKNFEGLTLVGAFVAEYFKLIKEYKSIISVI